MNVTRHVQIILAVVNRVSGPARSAAASLWMLARTAQATFFFLDQFRRVASHFMQINSTFEELETSFAGVMKAKGLTTTFSEAQGQAKQLIDQLKDYAAVLPGTLEDYVDVAGRAYGEIAQLGFKTTNEQARFVSRYTAIATAFNVPSKQAGNDLNLILQGTFRNNTRMWARLRDEILKVAPQFAKLSKPDRAKALLTVFDHYQPMLNAFEDKWSAIWGTFDTHVLEIKRFAFEPIFENVKNAFKKINEYLFENKQFMVSMVQSATKLVALLSIAAALNLVAKRQAGASGLFNQGLMGVGRLPVGTLAQIAIGKLGIPQLTGQQVGMGALFSPGIGRLLTTMLSAAPRLMPIFNGLTGFVASLANAGSIIGVIGGASFLLVAVGAALYIIFTNFNGIRDELAQIMDVMDGYLEPFRQINVEFGITDSLLNGIGAIMVQAVDNIRAIFQFVAAIGAYVAVVIARLSADTRVQRHQIERQYGVNTQTMGPVETEMTIFGALLEEVEADAKKAASDKQKKLAALSPLKTPNNRNGPPNYNFYDSRFNITQQFAEGFDPDRIAVAFAHSIAKSAERKLQSSFAPVGAL